MFTVVWQKHFCLTNGHLETLEKSEKKSPYIKSNGQILIWGRLVSLINWHHQFLKLNCFSSNRVFHAYPYFFQKVIFEKGYLDPSLLGLNHFRRNKCQKFWMAKNVNFWSDQIHQYKSPRQDKIPIETPLFKPQASKNRLLARKEIICVVNNKH